MSSLAGDWLRERQERSIICSWEAARRLAMRIPEVVALEPCDKRFVSRAAAAMQEQWGFLGQADTGLCKRLLWLGRPDPTDVQGWRRRLSSVGGASFPALSAAMLRLAWRALCTAKRFHLAGDNVTRCR